MDAHLQRMESHQYGEGSFAITKDLNLKTMSEGERRDSRRGHTACDM